MSTVTWDKRIVATPDTCHGKPRINGTRITVSSVLDNLSEGHSIDSITKDLEISKEDVMACLSYASYSMDIKESLSHEFHIDPRSDPNFPHLWNMFIHFMESENFIKNFPKKGSIQFSKRNQRSKSNENLDRVYKRYFTSNDKTHIEKLEDLLKKLISWKKLSVEEFTAVCLYSYIVIGEETVSKGLVGGLIKGLYEDSKDQLKTFENPKLNYYEFINKNQQLTITFEGREKATKLLEDFNFDNFFLNNKKT